MSRIFVFCSRSPHADGVASLLSPRCGLEVLGWETDPERALRRIARIRPEVVIATGDEPEAHPPPYVADILAASAGTMIIEAGTEADVLHVYGKGLKLAHDLKDLLDAIESSAGGDQSLQACDEQAKTSSAANAGSTVCGN